MCTDSCLVHCKVSLKHFCSFTSQESLHAALVALMSLPSPCIATACHHPAPRVSNIQEKTSKAKRTKPWQVVHGTAVKAVLLAVQHVQDPVVPPVALEIGLALLGAALGGLLLTPIIRTMRSFVSALEVPEWATQQLRFPAWLSFTLHLNLVLPALGMVIWVCVAVC